MIIEPLPRIEGGFTTILADPPWRYGDKLPGPGRGAEKFYPTLSVAEICAIPVAEIAADKAHLYLWVTNSHVDEGFDVMRAWGFDYKTNIVWVKTTKDGIRPAYGMGRYFRGATEICLLGTRGGLRAENSNQRNVFFSPRLRHSEKPQEFYRMIEVASAPSYLELFARGKARENWTVWGNEAIQ